VNWQFLKEFEGWLPRITNSPLTCTFAFIRTYDVFFTFSKHIAECQSRS
jgi:hypothetical protein